MVEHDELVGAEEPVAPQLVEHDGERAHLVLDLVEHFRFDARYRNGQDRFFLYKNLLRDKRIAYLDQVHLIYRVHSENDSLSRSTPKTVTKLGIGEQYFYAIGYRLGIS